MFTRKCPKALNCASKYVSRSAFHSVARVGQSAPGVVTSEAAAAYEASYEQLKEGLKYYKANNKLRELVYKPKNANRLLSLELYNEEEGTRITPKIFDGAIKKSALTTLLLSSSTYGELQRAEKVLLDYAKFNKFPKNKHYLKEEHFINLLIAGAKLNKLPHVLTFLYSNNLSIARFLSFQIVEFIHVLNNIIKINAGAVDLKGYSLKDFVDKLNIPLAKLRRYKPKNVEHAFLLEPKVALTYVAALINYASVKPKAKAVVDAKIIEVFNQVDISKLDIESIAKIKASTFKPEKHFEYFILKAVQEQFLKVTDDSSFTTQVNSVLEKINPSIVDFEKAIAAENKQNLYQTVLAQSKFGKPEAQKAEEEASS